MNMLHIAYNWQLAGATVLIAVAAVALGSAIFLRIPALAKSAAENTQKNREKRKAKRAIYRLRVKPSQQIGLAINLSFAIAVLPFIVTTESRALWRIVFDVFLILMVYDFFYYLMHRFLFHKQSYFKKVHGVHHIARSRVSSVDAFLLHPLELFLGIALYYAVIVGIALAYGERLHTGTLILGYVIYTQLNLINHCYINLDKFPWKTLNWIALKHDAHHLSMQHGNYATITLFFDWLFGTLETHPLEGKMQAQIASAHGNDSEQQNR